jgi:hypothetical protein
MDKTTPFIFCIEGLSIGFDYGDTVDHANYRDSFPFTGTIKKVTTERHLLRQRPPSPPIVRAGRWETDDDGDSHTRPAAVLRSRGGSRIPRVRQRSAGNRDRGCAPE